MPGFFGDINARFFEFDGNKLHSTKAFTGAPCSLVHFTLSNCEKTLPNVCMELHDAGFNFPWSCAQNLLQGGTAPVAPNSESARGHDKESARGQINPVK